MLNIKFLEVYDNMQSHANIESENLPPTATGPAVPRGAHALRRKSSHAWARMHVVIGYLGFLSFVYIYYREMSAEHKISRGL